MARKKTGKKKRTPPKEMARKPEEEKQLPRWFEIGVDFLLKFERFARDIGGIILLVIASLTLLSLIGLTSGAWLTPWAALLRRWMGVGSLFVVLACGIGGVLLIRKQNEEFSSKDWQRVIWLEVSAFSAVTLLTIMYGNSLERAEAGLDGGLVGWGISEFIGLLLKSLPPGVAGFLRAALLVVLLFYGVMYGLGFLGKVILKLEESLDGSISIEEGLLGDQPAVVVGGMKTAPQPSKDATTRRKRTTRIPAEHRKKFKVEDQEDDRIIEPKPRDAQLPSLEILLGGESVKPNERHINQTA
ncbi:MAG: hypothetical protein E3J88_03125, partial [Anaerolineales bacterium]